MDLAGAFITLALALSNVGITVDITQIDGNGQNVVGTYLPLEATIEISENSPIELQVESLQHEAVHVIQDCTDGKLDGRVGLIGIPITAKAQAHVEKHYPEDMWLIEGEAFTLESYPLHAFEKVLELCAGFLNQ